MQVTRGDIDRNLEIARETLELARSHDLVGIFLGFEGSEAIDLILIMGQTESELCASLRNHPGKAVALIGWRELGEGNIVFRVLTFNEFLADPWAKGLLENFQTDYRKALAYVGLKTELVH